MVKITLDVRAQVDLHCDNQAIIAFTKNPNFHCKTKHKNTHCKYLRVATQRGNVTKLYINLSYGG